LSGRLAPASPVAGVAVEDGVEGRGGVVLNGAEGLAPGRLDEGGVAGRGELGTNGGAPAWLGAGGATGVGRGAIPEGLKGGCAGVCGAGVNPGSPDAGEGGVAVAAAVVRSIDSGRGRGTAGTSADHGCCGGPAGRGADGADDDGAAGVRCAVSPKIAVFQSLFGGVGRGGACAGSLEDGEVRWLPIGGVL